MTTTLEKIHAAGAAGRLLPETVANLAAWLDAGLPPWAAASIDELVARETWGELNDRFYRYLEFGTGGMRGRTIGAIAARAETGTPGALGAPEHPAVGSNLLNDFTLVRATIGLYRYVHGHLAKTGRYDPPKLVIAHDVRYFSRHFCELAASTWSRPRRRGLHLQRPALDAATQLLGAVAEGPLRRGHHRQPQSAP